MHSQPVCVTLLSVFMFISKCVLLIYFQGILVLLKMKGLFLVEPIVALYAFSSFLIYPLVQQYVYRRLWQELTNTTYPVSANSSRCAENSSAGSNHSSFNEVSNTLITGRNTGACNSR